MRILLSLATVIVAVLSTVDVLYASELRITTLNDNAPPNRGRLDIKPDGGVWGVICEAGWGTDDARAACLQLGYTGGREIRRPRNIATSGLPYHYGRFQCTDTEDSLDECDKHPSTCGDDPDSAAGVHCRNIPEPCAPGYYWPRTTPDPLCTPCQIGHYKYRSDDSECTKCPGARTTFAEGTISRDDCFEVHGYYNVDGAGANTDDLLDGQVFVQYGKRAPKLQILDGTVVEWKVEVDSTDPVTLAFWREDDNQQLEYVGGTTMQFDELGTHTVELSAAEQFHVKNGDSIGLIWNGKPVVTKVTEDCGHKNNKQYFMPSTDFNSDDTLQIPDNFVNDKENCHNFNVQAIVERYYPEDN